MAEGNKDWIIDDSEEEDQLCSPELNGHHSASLVLPGAHLPS